MTSAPPPSSVTPPTSPRPKRVATPSWLDLRLVLGVVLVLASVLIGAKVVAGASDTDSAVAVTRDLAAGTMLTGDDLRVTQVQLGDGGGDHYLSATKDAIGKRLTRAVSRGELLPAAAVGQARAQTTLTVPLAAGAAPQLRTGQRIELWVSSSTCAFVVLLPDVTVQTVRADAGNSFGGGSGAQNVVINVDPSQAGRVIQALSIENATVRAGVLVGPAPTAIPSASTSATSSANPSATPLPSTASGTSAAGSDRPSDLAACASAQPTR